MAIEDNPLPPPPPTDKIIPFSILNKVPIKLDLEKHNYNSWSSFSLIHLGSLGLKSHVEQDTASTNPDWCQLDDLIKMWILGSLCDSLQEQVVTTPGNAKALWDHLKDLFHDNKDARAITLDNELRSIKIGKMTVNEYCTKIQSMENRLKNLDCQFTRDNNCTIEFDAYGFSVKDFLTHHILIRCDSSSDLYSVTKLSTLPAAFVSTSSTTWHQRLGHPGDEVLCSLSSHQFISCNKVKSTHVCHACQVGKHVKLPFHSSNSLVKQSFNIIHSELWTSPIPYPLHTSSVSHIPKSPFLALKDPNWCNAMYDEYNVLVKNGTWILVPRPTDANLVRSMWLFKHKFHADGTLSRYKAQLVANGSSQQLGWPIHQLDVKNAFFNGDLSEIVYMHQPPGFVDSRYPNHVCILQCPLYGLKQAPRAWFQRFAGYATRASFSPSRCDSSLFIFTQGSQVAYLLIYVDDIILSASSSILLQQIVDSLHKEFDMTDLRALNYFLGISVVRHPTGLFLS
ncbi:ribonuclease H-like domain-containing protein [Tanacetum coccineum]